LSKSLILFLALLSIVPAIGAEDNPAMPVLRAVVESERKFAHTCLEHGIRESFLQFFADDSIIFAPAPTNGKAFYAKYEDKGRRLIWQPIFATVSNSGDLGVTTGPWELKKSATEETPLAFGQFVSIWRKQPDNSWKVIVDVGIDNPQPTKPPGEIQFLSPNETPRNIDATVKHDAIEQPQKMFLDALKDDAGAAINAVADGDIRVFRDNSFPAVGKDAAKVMLGSDHRKMTRKTSGHGISASTDLGYQYGSYSSEHDNSTEPGYFLTIWKVDRNGDWKIILDLQKKGESK
jgi:ketosteroid isomerase-like protein